VGVGGVSIPLPQRRHRALHVSTVRLPHANRPHSRPSECVHEEEAAEGSQGGKTTLSEMVDDLLAPMDGDALPFQSQKDAHGRDMLGLADQLEELARRIRDKCK